MRITRWIPAVFFVATAILVSGCSTFNRDWKKAAASPVQSGSVDGAWDGKWLSDRNGHTGRLRCLLTEKADGTHQARFHAVYWKLFRFSYTADFKMEPATAGETHFKGGADLGWWGGGVYGYDGRIWSTNFFSTYTNKYDHGTFEMHRAHEGK